MVLPSQIVFLHGLESSARGKKFQYLKKLGVPVFAVDMPCGRGLRGVASDLPLVLSLGLFLFAVCILLSLVRRVVFFFLLLFLFQCPTLAEFLCHGCDRRVVVARCGVVSSSSACFGPEANAPSLR